MRYAIIEVLGRQYKVEPGKEVLVNNLGDVKEVEAQVLLLADEEDLDVGKPFLKEKLMFDVLEQVKGEKIRVAKYHSKANTRKVRGSRAILSKIKLQEKKSNKSVKKD